MEFDDQDEQEEEMGPPASYEQVSNSSPPRPGNSSLGRKSGAGARSRYRECLKNHAVGIGGHAVDGCGEFMAAGEEGTLDALKCAACHCHRNFHRKEIEREGIGGGVLPQLPFSPYYRTPTNAGYFHVAPHYRPPTLALPSTSGGGCGREDQEDISNLVGGLGVSSGKKRNRTKFTQEQKEKMLDFAEKVGWRIQKQDEAAVQEFCTETCVKRHVLKVWMHNNKHTLGKKP